MRAVTVLARRVLRTSFVRTGLLVLVLATSLGFAVFSATAARRTATAYDRFVAWSHAPDVVTGSSAGDVPVAESFDEVAALPSVVDAQPNMAVGISGARVHGRVLPASRFFASTFEAADGSFDRALVLEGHLPSEPTERQGAIDFVTARQLDLHVGDEVTLLAGLEEGAAPKELPIEVVAVISVPTVIPTVAGYQHNNLVMGPAFRDAHPELIDPWESSLSMHLRDGLDSVDDLRQEMAEAGLDDIDLQDRAFVEVGAERLFTLEATTMWVAAALALLVGLPVAYQLIRRDVAAMRPDLDTVLALGASRRQLALAAAARGASAGLVAAVAGSAVALIASPSSPVGLARNAEVERGLYVDATVLLVGVPLFIAAVAVLATLAVVRGALAAPRPQRRERAARSRQPRVPVAVGVRMATGSRGPVAVAGIGALVFVAVLVVGIAVAASSLESVPDDPEVSGGAWDAFLVVAPEARPAVEQALEEAADVAAYGPGGWLTLDAQGEPVFTLHLPDSLPPIITEGRAPEGDDEVALGAAAMRRLGVHIGDEVPVTFPGYELEPRSLTVTGESITAAPLFFSHAPDDGAVVGFEVPRPTGSDGSAPELVRFGEGTGDPEDVLERVVADLPEETVFFSFARGRRGDVVALDELQGLFDAILAMAAGLALASLLHQVLLTHRRNASEVGVLRAVGFTRADVAEAGAAHGGALALVTAAVAIPIGLAAGNSAWRFLAGELVLLPRTRYDLVTILVAGAGVIVVAALLAAVLARRSARRPVAVALRAE